MIAAAEGAGGDLDALRRWLADRLPTYAAPRQLLRLPRLPRTAGGKIDRQALIHRHELSVDPGLRPNADEESP